MPDALGLADLGRAVRVHEDRQRQPPGGEREPDRDRRDDPLVPVPPRGVRVAKPDGVPVPALAVHLRPRVPVHRVVADRIDRPVGDDVGKQDDQIR